MPETAKFELAPAMAQAVAMLPTARDALRRVYDRDRGRFFAAAMKNPNRNDPILSTGRAEHYIHALRALGVLAAGTPEEIRLLLRSSDRRVYDAIQRRKQELQPGERARLEDLLPRPRDDESPDIYFARTIIAAGTCAHLGIPIEGTPAVMDMVHYVHAHKSRRAHENIRDENAIRAMRAALGSDRMNGVTGLYESIGDDARTRYDHLFAILNAEGIDSGIYTDSMLLTPLDAVNVTAEGDPVVNALLVLLSRAIKADRAFCLELYNDSRSDELDAIRIEAENARRQIISKDDRITELENKIMALEKKNAALQKEIDARAGDAAELAALRDALYRAADDTPPETTPKAAREIPDGVIAIGGHSEWARRLSESSGIRVWPTGTTCPRSVIDNASEIWIQPAYMAHTEYYAVIERVRRRNISISYFSSTGVNKCLEELKQSR